MIDSKIDSAEAYIKHVADMVVQDVMLSQRLSDALKTELELIVKAALRTSQKYEYKDVDWSSVAADLGIEHAESTADVARNLVDPIVKAILDRFNRFETFLDHKDPTQLPQQPTRKWVYLAE
jgi:Holliday junction resolvase RusA-like endonuclease